MKLNINDEQGIELLYFIFEREYKPPFRKGDVDSNGYYPYYNRNDDIIGWFGSTKNNFITKSNPFMDEIGYKVSNVFGYDTYGWDWWAPTKFYLKSWLEDQINIKLSWID